MNASKPLRVMIVEDEALLALQLEDDLTEMGLDVVGSAISSGEAVRLAQDLRPDLAFVDIHLVDGPTGVEVAEKLSRDEGTVVVFMTANLKRIPPDFAGAVAAIGKPYTSQGLNRAVAFISQAMVDGAAPPPPLNLHISPALAAAQDQKIRFSLNR